MRIIDISWPIVEGMTEYKDKKSLNLRQTKNFETDGFRETLICFNSHTGTHIDSPAHFLKDGKTLDKIALDKLVGECQVLDFSDIDEKITKDDLEKYDIQSGDIIILKTKNSELSKIGPFNSKFVGLSPCAADYLVSKNIKSVGIDYLGIECGQPKHEVHQKLLENEILIIEGLRLAKVEAGKYFLCCLPLKFIGLDGSVARAILLEKNID
jgi:arylformamidase